MLKKCSTFAPESCEFEHGGAHPDKAIKRGRSFPLVVSFLLFLQRYHLGGKIARLLFLVTKYF